MRGATQYSPPPPSTVTISIHAPHAGRDLLVCTGQFGIAISIHAPHAGRDRGRGRQGHADEDFNPRAPCGARPLPLPNPLRPQPFQSTRPMRGATGGSAFSYLIGQISIHAPHAGRDGVFGGGGMMHCISIHAPHAGRDKMLKPQQLTRRHFNPRAPCGARLIRRPMPR